MYNNVQAGGNQPDLLSSILEVEIRNEEKISEHDRQFCQQQQDQLYAVLTHLEQWYNLFTTNLETYKESHRLTINKNGSVKEGYHSWSSDEEYRKYSDFAFLPFKNINTCTGLAHEAIITFAKNIVKYFSNTYNIQPDRPEVDTDNMPWGFRPVY